jgi:hypothetical protein
MPGSSTGTSSPVRSRVSRSCCGIDLETTSPTVPAGTSFARCLAAVGEQALVGVLTGQRFSIATGSMLSPSAGVKPSTCA